MFCLQNKANTERVQEPEKKFSAAIQADLKKTSTERGNGARSFTGRKASRRDMALEFYLLHFLARK